MNFENTFSVSDICMKFWEFEKRHELLDYKIKNIYVWQLVRFKMFNKLLRKKGIYGVAHSNADSVKDKILETPRMLVNSLLKNPFLGKYKRDIIIFDHPRKVKVGKEYIDIYTYNFIENQKKNKIDVLEAPYLRKHMKIKSEVNRKYTDHQWLNVLLKKTIKPIKLTEYEKENLKELERVFLDYFQIEGIDLYNNIVEALNRHYHKYNYYYKLLKKREPKVLYIVVSYNNMSLIAAAKDLNIKVIEFQHGVITNYHFAYNFGDPSKDIKYFPDKMLTFGDFWARTKGFPAQTEIEVYGYPYLNEQLEIYKGVKKKQNQVIFISQGTIGRKLANYAFESAKAMPEYNFIYKLHPGEFDRWKKEYPELIEAAKLNNFQVIDNNNYSLYSYLAESEFQVGVYSTAIFEGLALDCKTILYNLAGIEYMEDLIEQNFVMVANDSIEFKKKIRSFKVKEINKNTFFKSENNVQA